MPSGEEIQAALRAFAARWREYDGGERQGAQTFLNELARCYDTDLFAEGVKFEDSSVPGGFMDMYWRDRAIVEMKAPGETHRLLAHREQVLLTRNAAGLLALLYQLLVDHGAIATEILRNFLMQLVWCLFAEDLEM